MERKSPAAAPRIPRAPFRRKLEIIEELANLAREFREQRKRDGLPYISIETGERVAGRVGEDLNASGEEKGKKPPAP